MRVYTSSVSFLKKNITGKYGKDGEVFFFNLVKIRFLLYVQNLSNFLIRELLYRKWTNLVLLRDERLLSPGYLILVTSQKKKKKNTKYCKKIENFIFEPFFFTHFDDL
jgi:hypothetical protein